MGDRSNDMWESFIFYENRDRQRLCQIFYHLRHSNDINAIFNGYHCKSMGNRFDETTCRWN